VSPGVVVLDLDGTLLDTRWRHHRVYADIVTQLGGQAAPLPQFWAAKRRGAPWSALLAEAFGPQRRGELSAAFLEAFARQIEAEPMLTLDRLQPGARTAISRLAGAGHDAILVTARHQGEALKRQLEALSLSDCFASVVATAGSPKHLSLGAAGRLVHWIGDTEEDLTSARMLGVDATLVANGIRNRRVLAQLNPERIVSSVGVAVSDFLKLGRAASRT